MNTRTVRELNILLPELDRDDLDPRDPPGPDSTVADAHISGETWRRARITNATIIGSWFGAADLTESRWELATLAGCEFHNADLTADSFTETSFDRCLIHGCRLTGAHLSRVTLKNTVFENCRLDYATLDQLHTAGPVALLGCSLTETTLAACRLTSIVLEDCQLRGTAFGTSDLRGADMRGIDLSSIHGATALRGATIDHAQLPGLTTALARDLELTIR